MKKWVFWTLLGLGFLWYELHNYYTEQRIKQSAPVRYIATLRRDEQKAEQAVAKSQAAFEERMKEYQKGD
jgi:hypothetical protein